MHLDPARCGLVTALLQPCGYICETFINPLSYLNWKWLIEINNMMSCCKVRGRKQKFHFKVFLIESRPDL